MSRLRLMVLQYVHAEMVTTHMSCAELIDTLTPVVDTEMANQMLVYGQRIATQAYYKGIDEGLLQGLAAPWAMCLSSLTRRFGELSTAAVRRVSNASGDELIRWCQRLVHADTLDDVFAQGDVGTDNRRRR